MSLPVPPERLYLAVFENPYGERVSVHLVARSDRDAAARAESHRRTAFVAPGERLARRAAEEGTPEAFGPILRAHDFRIVEIRRLRGFRWSTVRFRRGASVRAHGGRGR